MKVLITGITGMVGSHLADYILDMHPEVEIHGLIRWRSPRDNIRHIEDKLELHLGDLRDMSSLIYLMRSARPDIIFHLAAQSYVPVSFDTPVDTFQTNAIGTINLLEAILSDGEMWPKIMVCSSSEVYGQPEPGEVPIKETNPLRPASPYAVSKVAEDLIAYQYVLTHGLYIVRTRMFTHTGPRRGDVFVASAFAKQIAMIEAGKMQNPIKVGNLDSVRTFLDVRDAVDAYWTLMSNEEILSGEVFNIGGHATMTIGDMLDTLKGMATCPIEEEVDAHLLRPSDVTLQIPDISKFIRATGWRPSIPFKVTMEDLMKYHRERICLQQ